ncbi:hypothetical protein PVAG01_01532 [Phlyctema vagabunda]|uniref:Uncharacterized protein n=1 Tax=Phlyctema vagabunda TaxID=108571 RepID=A0ABR4PXC4_9HELO
MPAPPPSFPSSMGSKGPADLRRSPLDDSDLSSNAGSTSSGRRRRRARKNKGAVAGLAATAAPVIQRLEHVKPVRLQLGLNLDVELELKARIQGDVSLTLLVQKKGEAMKRDGNDEYTKAKHIGFNRAGVVDLVDICYIRLGTFSFRQKWLQREVSSSLTFTVALALAGSGLLVGFLCGWYMARWSVSGSSRMNVLINEM